MVKSEFYDMYGSGFDSLCIGSERRPQVHSRMRKSLTPAFSTKALAEQESIVQMCIDEFIEKVGEQGTQEKGLDMTKWFEMLAFDILGEMAFGETLHCIQNARRLESKSPRKDFLTNLVQKVETGEVGREEMTAHASTLIIAGGETVATFLAATTYYILKNPSVYAELCKEICSHFHNLSNINATAAQQLPYLQAVISEGLRIYPPGSQGFPRLSPGAEIAGMYIPPGTEVYTSAWTVTHDTRYFHDPYAFKPSRWLDPACTDIKEASQAFSLGSRSCLGRK
ncbi:hypothetical protein MaudCBS49596_000217 [Microsporum audouinii]